MTDEISDSKMAIIQKVESAKVQYQDALKLLKESHCIDSRIMYGALLKDFSNSIFHASRQVSWIIHETDNYKGEAQ